MISAIGLYYKSINMIDELTDNEVKCVCLNDVVHLCSYGAR